MQLDLLSLGASVPSAIEAHVARCSVCAVHVRRVRDHSADLATRREPAAIPGRVRGTGRGARRASWNKVTVGLLLAASLAVVYVGSPPHPMGEAHTSDAVNPTGPNVVAAAAAVESGDGAPPSPPYTNVRGAPSTGVYVRRGPRTALWDGQTPLRAGDALRIRVAPEGYTRVTVFLQKALAPWSVLYEGDIDPRRTQLLPRAWELDGHNEDERLVTVLSHHAVNEALARAALAGHNTSLWARVHALRASTTESSP